jgi:murein DD-endopeptidase MepM/ murein hydrolase activator NlpD
MRLREHDALRQLAAAAGIGFVAGFCTLAMLVWYFGNFVGLRPQVSGIAAHAAMNRAGPAAPPLHPPEPPAATPPDPTGTRGSMPPPPAVESTIGAEPLALLRNRRLTIPVEGVERSALIRSYADARSGGRQHEAIDILAPRNTPVRAVEAGTIAKLFTSRYGGLTIYQFDPDQKFIYYYAHLERYAPDLKEGLEIRRGQVIGYVGTSGNAPPNTPHLHFAIFRAQEPPRWWEGMPLDPYDVLR